MAYLGVPILQDVSITFYHYSGIVRGSRFVLVCFSFVFRKVRGQARKRWRVGERKKAFLSPLPTPTPYRFLSVWRRFRVRVAGTRTYRNTNEKHSPQKAFFASYNLEQSLVPVQALSFAKRVLNQGFNPGRYGILKVKYFSARGFIWN